MILDDIAKMIEDHKPPPDPFNGATRLVLARGLLTALAPHLEPWTNNPLMGQCPEIEVSPLMPDGCGMGFRKWRVGDDAEMEVIGEVCVWLCSPKLPKEE